MIRALWKVPLKLCTNHTGRRRIPKDFEDEFCDGSKMHLPHTSPKWAIFEEGEGRPLGTGGRTIAQAAKSLLLAP